MIRGEITSAIGLKLIAFSGMFLQVDSMMGASELFKYLDSFGVLAVLVLGIRYFISELKRQQGDFNKKWKEQEDRHDESNTRALEMMLKSEEVANLKLDTLQKENIELKISLAKYE